MPGIIMDDPSARTSEIVGERPLQNSVDRSHTSLSPSPSRAPDGVPLKANGRHHSNGLGPHDDAVQDSFLATLSPLPVELVHISQGFFPLGQLVNRAAQSCWNDLTDVISQLADSQHSWPQAPQHLGGSPVTTNGKPPTDRAWEVAQKKLRIMEFAQAKRAEFIKILVLSQWSRRAIDVSKLIDLQAFIRTRYDIYNGAILRVGEMKRDLVRAQMGNPDLETASQILLTGKPAAMQELGLIPPRCLTPKKTLKRLQLLNKLISTRLVLNDTIPAAFRNYCVHDGRVTFIVPAEFEVDLSIGSGDPSSQFFFVDIRFLFSPSPAITKGGLLESLDFGINNSLMTSGLSACFKFIHNLTLTTKVSILFRQAIELAHGHWLGALRVELLHRTLIVQYWVNRAGPRSWIEIGVNSGRQVRLQHVSEPFLALRWMREGKEVDSKDVSFNIEALSMESILRSAIAIHVSELLSSSYGRLCQGLLYGRGVISAAAQTSFTEPGDCYLDVQLVKTRNVRVTIEPISGTVVLRPTPLLLNRQDIDRASDRSSVEDIVHRVSRLRSGAVMEEAESLAKSFGWETVNPRGLKNEDLRKIFPQGTLRFILFRGAFWQPGWLLAQTSSLDGDKWWILQLRETKSTFVASDPPSRHTGPSTIHSAHMISRHFTCFSQDPHHASFAELQHALSGMITMLSNVQYLAELRIVRHSPHSRKLLLGDHLQVPSIHIHFQSSALPAALRISPSVTGGGAALIRDTIRLSFQGFDLSSRRVILVAHGQLALPWNDASTLVMRADNTVSFQPKGGGFAMRFLVPIGQPVIIPLLCRLQQLEYVLFSISSLDKRVVEPRSMSLSKLQLAYSTDGDPPATIRFQYTGEMVPPDIDTGTLLARTVPLAHLRTSVYFHPQSVACRIRGPLSAMLNGSNSKVALNEAMRSLVTTLPLMRVLDRISSVSKTGSRQGSTVQITARGMKVYLLRYPATRFRFHITVGQRRDHVICVLKEATSSSEKAKHAALNDELNRKVYYSHGDGWKGLGNGAVADASKVEGLLLTLHDIMGAHAMIGGSQQDINRSGAPGKAQDMAAVKSDNALSDARPKGDNGKPQDPNASKGADIIMID